MSSFILTEVFYLDKLDRNTLGKKFSPRVVFFFFVPLLALGMGINNNVRKLFETFLGPKL